mgnify:CR=1 FL=1|jgi:hypothetical protein
MIFPTTSHDIGFSDSSTTASSKVADRYTMTKGQDPHDNIPKGTEITDLDPEKAIPKEDRRD